MSFLSISLPVCRTSRRSVAFLVSQMLCHVTVLATATVLAAVPSLAQVVSFAGQQTIPISGVGSIYGVALDAFGNVYFSTLAGVVQEAIAVNGVIPANPTIVTLASGLSSPRAIALDSQGDVFVADSGDHTVKEILAVNGAVPANATIRTLSAAFQIPFGVAVDGNGNVFVTDPGSGSISEIVASGGSIPANPTVRMLNTSEDDPGLGIAVDPSGNVYFTGDTDPGQTVNEILAVNGSIPASPTIRQLLLDNNNPNQVVLDSAGDLFLGDDGPGVKEIVAANGSIPSNPVVRTIGVSGSPSAYGIAVNNRGVVFFADLPGQRVFEVQAQSVSFGSANVCAAGQTTPAPCLQQLTLYYDTTDGVTLGTPLVLTQGTPNLDFTLNSTTCTGAQNGSQCTVVVNFIPQAPGTRNGAVEILDNNGNLLTTTPIYGVGQGSAVAFRSGVAAKRVFVDGKVDPQQVVTNSAGDVFIADSGGRRVLKIPAGGGSAITLESTFQASGVAVDGAGNVFASDLTDDLLVQFTYNPVLQTYSPPADVIEVFGPQGVAIDGAGNIFVGANEPGRVIRIGTDGAQTQIAYTFSQVAGLAADSAGDVFVVDYGNGNIVEVPASGAAPAPVPNLSLQYPLGVAVDAAGDIFATDNANSRYVELPADGSPVHSVGSGGGSSGGFIEAIAVDTVGNLYFGDDVNGVTELPRATPPSLNFASTPVGQTSSDSPQSFQVDSIGNQPLTAFPPGLSIGSNFAQVEGSGSPADCNPGFSLVPGAECNLSLSFTPTTSGSIQSAATFFDNALNASPFAIQTVTLTGTGTLTTTVISFPLAPVYVYGQSFQLSATSNDTAVPITYSVLNGPVTLVGNTVTVTGVGGVTLQASQVASSGYTSGSQQAGFTATASATKTTLQGAVLATPGNTASLTASVTAEFPGVPTGSVTFYNGTNPLATVALVNGTATYTTPAYSGQQGFSATFNATNSNPNYVPSSSNTVPLTFTVAPTITFAVAGSYAYGQSFQAAATSNSSGAITYSLVSGPATVTPAGAVTVTGEGAVVVMASQAAASGYNAATKQAGFTAVQAKSTTVLTATAVKSGNASAASLSATVSPQYTGTPTGSITFYDGATKLATVALSGGKATYTTAPLVGTQHSFSAVYSGDANFTMSTSNTVALTIAVSTVTLQLAATTLVYPLPPAFEITVKPAGSAEPTGTVTIYDGATAIASYKLYALTKGYLLGLVLPPLNVGSHPLMAVYSGDANYAPGQSTIVTVTVTPGPVRLSLSCANTKLNPGQALSCTVNADEGPLPVAGTVNYTVTGLSAGSVTLNKLGQATISVEPKESGTVTATYAAQGNYAAAAPATVGFTIK